MKEQIRKFMLGRYGVDHLSRFCLYVAVFFFIVNIFFRNMFLDWFPLILMFVCYFRIFSRNHKKRYEENQVYLGYYNIALAKIHRVKSDRLQRKTHHIYHCPGCHQKIRVPKGKGKISIRCPKCFKEFVKKS